jgi:hypothetical protein
VSLDEGDAAAGSAQHLGLTALQQLQRLEGGCGLEPQLLKQLSTLTALTDIVLVYEDAVSAQRAAPGWQHLSVLRSLYIENDEGDTAQDAVLLQGLAAATSLTHLYIQGPIASEGLQLCAHLAALSQLQILAMHNAGVASRSDALQLAALTSLTHLALDGAVGVDDVAASVLALRLTRLRELRLTNCGLRSAAALPSIATLTGLTFLDLTASDSAQSEGAVNLLPLGPEDVLLLTPLTQLKHFIYNGFFHSAMRFWDKQKRRWRQQPPAWLCQVHAPQQQP